MPGWDLSLEVEQKYFLPAIREELCPEKLSGEEWLNTMRIAHNLGLRSNATMLYGHIEKNEDRINHLIKLRELQDETGGFMSFIPLAFHPKIQICKISLALPVSWT